jgi:hypothetical protein
MIRQRGAQPHAQHRAAEDARENQQSSDDGIHDFDFLAGPTSTPALSATMFMTFIWFGQCDFTVRYTPGAS